MPPQTLVSRRMSGIAAAWDSLDEIERELEWRKCANGFAGFLHFCRTYFAIKVPSKGQRPFTLRDAQVDTAKIWFHDRFSITLKARQIGFSTLVAALSLWHVMFHPDREIIVLSKTGKDAKKLLRTLGYAWKAMPVAMRERAGKVVADTQEKFELDNGSSVESLNSNNPARGYSAFKIFVDEFAFYEKADEAWAAIEPASDVGGNIHVLSTANGVGNTFHRMWVEASTHVSDYKPIFFSWRAGDRDDAWYATKRRSMPEWQLHQEYPSSPEEAFIKSGRPVFDPDMVKDLQAKYADAPEYRGYLDGGFVINVDGDLQVWEKPQPGMKYAIGADVAEGLEHGDFSTAYVLKLVSGEIVAEFHGHLDPDAFADLLYELGMWYHKALLAPEVNNHGMATCLSLKKARYPRLYRRIKREARSDKRTERLGWLTNAQTKRVMIDELRQALRDEELILKSGGTFGELRTFVRDGDGKMHGSPYDDRVMGLAITNQMRLHFFQRSADDPIDTSGTWGAYEDRMAAKRSETSYVADRIGLFSVY